MLAIPSWATDTPVIVLDLTAHNGVVFSALSPTEVGREDLLQLANLPTDGTVQVFFHTQTACMHSGQRVRPWTGVTVSFLNTPHRLQVGPALEEMLQGPQHWDSDSPVPSIPGHAFAMLTDEGRTRYIIDETRRAQIRRDVADFLGYDSRRLTLRGALPRAADVSLYGKVTTAVVVATQAIPRPPARPDPPKVVAFDLRPVMQGFLWEIAGVDSLRVSDLERRFGAACPPGHHVVVVGGRPVANPAPSIVLSETTQLLVIAYQPDQADSPSSSDAEMQDASSDDEASSTEGSDTTLASPASDPATPRSRSPRSPRPRTDRLYSPVDEPIPPPASFGDKSASVASTALRQLPETNIDACCPRSTRHCSLDLVDATGDGSQSTPPSHPGQSHSASVRALETSRPPPGDSFPADLTPPDETSTELSTGGHVHANLEATALLLTPGCTPEIVVLEGEPTVTFAATLIAVAARRSPARASLYDWLLPVVPQPDEKFFTFLALPSWLRHCERPTVVCLDARPIGGDLYSAVSPTVAAAPDLLRLHEAPPAQTSVLLGNDHPLCDPVTPVHLHTGILVTFAPAQVTHTRQPRRHPDATAAWSHSAPLPFGRTHWATHILLLTDGMPTTFQTGDMPTQEAMTRHLQYTTGQEVMQSPVPEITDASWYGTSCDAVRILTEQLRAIPVPPGVRQDWPLPVFLDCRPILRGFQWTLAPTPLLDVTTLCRRFASLAPHGFTPEILGPERHHIGNRSFVPAFAGQCLQVVFVRTDSDTEADDQTPEPNTYPNRVAASTTDGSSADTFPDSNTPGNSNDYPGSGPPSDASQHGSSSAASPQLRSRRHPRTSSSTCMRLLTKVAVCCSLVRPGASAPTGFALPGVTFRPTLGVDCRLDVLPTQSYDWAVSSAGSPPNGPAPKPLPQPVPPPPTREAAPHPLPSACLRHR